MITVENIKKPHNAKSLYSGKGKALQHKIYSISGSYKSGPGNSSCHPTEALRLCLETAFALRQKPEAGRRRSMAKEI